MNGESSQIEINIPINNEAEAAADPPCRCQDYLDQLQRLQAEFSNYKKRVQRQQEEWYEHSAREIIEEVVSILDDFDQMFLHSEGGAGQISRQGVKLIYEKMISILSKRGLEVINAQDSPFDPELHEAVLVEETDKVPQDTVVQVWQKGYKLKDKLLRPAKVKVSKNKGSQS